MSSGDKSRLNAHSARASRIHHKGLVAKARRLMLRLARHEDKPTRCGGGAYLPERGPPRDKSGIGRGVAQSGSASALGAEGRWFESSHPDHLSS